MDFSNQSSNPYASMQGSAAGTMPSAANTLRPESELEALVARVYSMAKDVEEIAVRMRNHADAVFGERPEAVAGANVPTPVRSGLLGSLQDALDSLDHAHAYAGVQAERNCALA